MSATRAKWNTTEERLIHFFRGKAAGTENDGFEEPELVLEKKTKKKHTGIFIM